jgi:organic hydroperoxide reductase OsmC/OhrA
MDIHCGVDLEWSSADNTGSITSPTGDVRYSALRLPDTASNGPSPEALLVAAISSCYSIALSNVLRASSLPQTSVSIRADGVIVSEFGKGQFKRVTVNPTIRGADILRRDAYEKAAIAARDECLIGRSIRGNVAYIVGDVSLQREATTAAAVRLERSVR